jgi:hypothetical protein
MGHLLHESQANLRLADDLAMIRLKSACNNPKEGCFSSPVASYESNYFIRIQMEASVLEDCLASEALADVIEMNEHGWAGWPEQLGSAIKKWAAGAAL